MGETVDVDMPLEGRVLATHLYWPADRRSDGVTVFFHGGGFVIGNLDTHDHACRYLCAGSDAAVIAVDYRLASEHRFPAAINDCFNAVCWIAEHAHLLSLDALRIVVAGDSAGGNLAAVMALRIRDEGGPSLCAQVLVYPVTDYHTPLQPDWRSRRSQAYRADCTGHMHRQSAPDYLICCCRGDDATYEREHHNHLEAVQHAQETGLVCSHTRQLP